jgi:hypothetical protein
MNKERLLRLADRLDKVKTKHFYFGQWFETPDKYERKIERRTLARIKNGFKLMDEGFCGSIACVLGHAALINEFRDKGLNIFFPTTDATVGSVRYKGHSNDAAGAEFFDIPRKHAASMFLPTDATLIFYEAKDTNNITPKKAAKAIRKYVETDGKFLEECIDIASREVIIEED